MKRSKLVAASLFAVLASMLMVSPANASTIYDLSSFPFYFWHTTSFHATLQTSVTGTFTTEAAIEAFLNHAIYSAVLMDGTTTLMDLNNDNATWDLYLGRGTSATLISTGRSLTLDFSTPLDITLMDLFLRSPRNVFQFSQQNSQLRDYNFVLASNDGVFQAYTETPYDAPFVFQGTRIAAPEASTIYLITLGLGGLGLVGRKRRIH